MLKRRPHKSSNESLLSRKIDHLLRELLANVKRKIFVLHIQMTQQLNDSQMTRHNLPNWLDIFTGQDQLKLWGSLLRGCVFVCDDISRKANIEIKYLCQLLKFQCLTRDSDDSWSIMFPSSECSSACLTSEALIDFPTSFIFIKHFSVIPHPRTNAKARTATLNSISYHKKKSREILLGGLNDSFLNLWNLLNDGKRLWKMRCH